LIRKMRGIQICGEKPEIKSASEKWLCTKVFIEKVIL
jgi:hypothetical protein